VLSTNDKSNCYSVIHVDAEGRHLSEYVNKSTDKVFMISAVSRMRLNTNQLMSSSDFSEIQSAKKTVHAAASKTHSHQSIGAETARLKLRTSQIGGVHRSLILLKTAVPSCVSNPESLL
jgi:hypothetical protein